MARAAVETFELEVRKDSGGSYQIYLDGSWCPSSTGDFHDNVDPADSSKVLGMVPECTGEEVKRAVEAAQRDFDVWRLTTGDFRTKVFYRFTELLKEHGDELVRSMTREMGKSLFDSKLDLLEAIGVCETLAPQGANLKGTTYQKLTQGLTMECRPAPRGVAAIITPFNFPVAIPLAQIIAALITGNTVVWKPSHLVPETSQFVAQLLEQALAHESDSQGQQVPPGIFHLLMGDARTGDALIRRPEVQVISFTGSKAVGNQIDSIASGLGKKVMKEVAGINIFYVHRDADIERAARNFIYGKTITSGQRCSSIQEALVDREVLDAFLGRVIELAPGVVYGPGASEELAAADAAPDRWSCPPLVSQEQKARLEKLVEASLEKGARVAYRAELPDELKQSGYYYPLTILRDVDSANPLYSEEAFGPVAVLTAVGDIREAIDIINSKIGIVACIDSRDRSATENFLERVLRTRIDDGRHGTGCFWSTKFGGDRGAGSGNASLDEDMVYGYVMWRTIYRAYEPLEESGR